MKMTGPIISLEDLIDKFQLCEKLLGKEVSEEHLKEVSRFIDDHERLTQQEMTAISRDGKTHDLYKRLQC